MGLVYAILAMTAFAVLGVSYKISDKQNCERRQANFFLFFFGGAFILLWSSIAGNFHITCGAVIFGIVMGFGVFFSVIVFRHALSKGRISVSWTIINLALIAPVLASVLIWGEIPHMKHYIGFALTILAIILLGIDSGRAGE